MANYLVTNLYFKGEYKKSWKPDLEADWCRVFHSTDLDSRTHGFLEHFSTHHLFCSLQNKHISNVLPCLVGMVTLHRVCTCSLLFPLSAHTHRYTYLLRAPPQGLTFDYIFVFSTVSEHANMFPADHPETRHAKNTLHCKRFIKSAAI